MTDLSPTAKDALAALRLRDALEPDAKARVRARIEASLAAGDVGIADAPQRDPGGALDARGIAIRFALPVAIAAAVLLSLWAIAPGDDARRMSSADRDQAAYDAEKAGDATATPKAARDAAAAQEDPRAEDHPPPTVAPPAPLPSTPPVDRVPAADAGPRPRDVRARAEPAGTAAPEAPEAPEAPSDTTLAEEMTLLKRARAAMRAGEPERALSVLSTHAETFARGQMAEDRDALKVEALCAAGRHEDARAAAGAFARTWPRSPHAARMDEICTAK